MKICLLQSTYLSWLGYYSLIKQSDLYVVFDTAFFSNQSWQQRNRIKDPYLNQELFLTVPIRHIGRPQLIKDVHIDNTQKWRRKHFMTLEYCYKRAPYWEEYCPFFRRIYSIEWEKLCDLNVAIIKRMMGFLNINTPMIYSSDLSYEKDKNKTKTLINICRAVGKKIGKKVTEFHEPAGGRNYIEEKYFLEAGIKLTYQDFKIREYRQLGAGFMPYRSAIDCLFNEGHNAWRYI